MFVSERLISTRPDVCSPDCISNALVHKPWMADNQKLSMARPIQFYHDTDEEWSSRLLSHSLHFPFSVRLPPSLTSGVSGELCHTPLSLNISSHSELYPWNWWPQMSTNSSSPFRSPTWTSHQLGGNIVRSSKMPGRTLIWGNFQPCLVSIHC